MPFNGTEGAPIPLATAAQMTADYRAHNPGTTQGTFFGKDVLNAMLAQPGCMGLRMYFALDALGNQTLVLTGADAAENDMVTGIVADFSTPCPPYCSTPNPLNT